jgi:hypothetical protein
MLTQAITNTSATTSALDSALGGPCRAERRFRDCPQDDQRGVQPAFRAVQWFIILTLRRSQLHQSVLVGLSACGIRSR